MPRIARNLKIFFNLKRRVQLPCKVEKTCKNAGCHVLLGRWGRMPFFLLLLLLLLHWGPPGEPPSRVLAAARRISKRRLQPSCKARKTCKNAGCHMLLGGWRPFGKARKTCKNAGCHMLLDLWKRSRGPFQKGLLNKKKAQNSYKYMVWQAPGDDLGLNS